ncbi:hypothetical protein ACOCEA_09405 [Maribacter sp. CXY002]|uniref:hypothetical protein n=1 Tax=Maribacter luteocoastalis TaxID=3407671 RepID=UPI003B67CAE0
MFCNKKKIKPFGYLAILWLLFAQISYAQNEYEPGYVILNTNDTLYGSIKDRKYGNLFNKIKFKPNYHKKTKRFSAYDLIGYKKGINRYESLWYQEESNFFRQEYSNLEGYGKKVFLKVLIKGKLSCYAKEYIQDGNGYFDYFELFIRDGENKFELATQGIFGLKKKRLKEYFKNCPNLVQKINNNGIKNPLDVVRFYNQFCGEE